MKLVALGKKFDAELTRIMKSGDENPIQRYNDAERARKKAIEFQMGCTRIKRQAIIELHDSFGWNYAMLAREFGLSRARIKQIAKEGMTNGLQETPSYD